MAHRQPSDVLRHSWVPHFPEAHVSMPLTWHWSHLVICCNKTPQSIHSLLRLYRSVLDFSSVNQEWFSCTLVVLTVLLCNLACHTMCERFVWILHKPGINILNNRKTKKTVSILCRKGFVPLQFEATCNTPPPCMFPPCWKDFTFLNSYEKALETDQ